MMEVPSMAQFDEMKKMVLDALKAGAENRERLKILEVSRNHTGGGGVPQEVLSDALFLLTKARACLMLAETEVGDLRFPNTINAIEDFMVAVGGKYDKNKAEEGREGPLLRPSKRRVHPLQDHGAVEDAGTEG